MMVIEKWLLKARQDSPCLNCSSVGSVEDKEEEQRVSDLRKKTGKFSAEDGEDH